jgi:Flp pilus assembly protein TadG
MAWPLHHAAVTFITAGGFMRRFCTSRLAQRLRDARGANIVEMALVMPLLFLLTFSIVDFASLFYVHLALENGVSQAARFGVTGNTTGAFSREDSIRDAMRQATPTLTLADNAFTFSHMKPGGAAWLPGSGNPSDISKVRVTYTWALMTPFIRVLFPAGQINLAVESAMLNEPKFE